MALHSLNLHAAFLVYNSIRHEIPSRNISRYSCVEQKMKKKFRRAGWDNKSRSEKFAFFRDLDLDLNLYLHLCNSLRKAFNGS